MENEEKELSLEEETCEPLTDEEFKEYQEKDARTTKRVLGVFLSHLGGDLPILQLMRNSTSNP